jgi:L-ribulose-5-phosphate 3-epimerase
MSQSVSRREMIRLGAGAVVAGGCAMAACGADVIPLPQKGPSMKKAVMWDMIKGGKTVLERFQMLKQAGFDGVEMNSPGGPPNPEIKEACAQTGIVIEGMVDSVHWLQTLSDPAPSIRAKGLSALEHALRDCKELGGTSVLLVPGVCNERAGYDDCYRRSQGEIRKALPLARELGVKIAVENVWNHFLLSPLEAARYIDEFEDPAIGWHMDIGNIVAYGYPEQWIRILGKRILKLHAKDFSRKQMNDQGLWSGFKVKLGDGDVDWPAVTKALADVGYNTWVCAEVAGGGVEELSDIARRMDRILSL